MLWTLKVKPINHMLELKLAFHSIGISCLGGAVFLQVLVFLGISTKGIFMGVEGNPVILNSEIGVTGFCVVYLGYLAVSRFRSYLKSA